MKITQSNTRYLRIPDKNKRPGNLDRSQAFYQQHCVDPEPPNHFTQIFRQPGQFSRIGVQPYKNEVLNDSIPVLLFSGPIKFSFGIGSGWKSVGEPGKVTKSEGPVLREIDGAPTLEFYKKYLGEDAKPSGECPLAVLDENGHFDYLRATAGAVDKETGVITYFADVPMNRFVQITVVDRDAILEGCQESVQAALDNYPEGHKPEASLFLSCAARRIQRSILPDQSVLNSVLPDHFILWEPRDVVGGDIYWTAKWGEGVLIVLGDCTGHGVPGAFMTLISTGAFERVLTEAPEGDSALMIQRMHQLIQNGAQPRLPRL